MRAISALLVIALPLCAAVVACGEPAPTVAQPETPAIPLNTDQLFAQLSTLNAAFGGAWVDADTRTLYVGSTRALPNDQLAALGDALKMVNPSVQSYEIRQTIVDYSYKQLGAWRTIVLDEFPKHANIIGLGINARLNRITIVILVGTDRTIVEKAIAAAGLPANAFQIQESARPTEASH